jgi:hypothetical protein
MEKNPTSADDLKTIRKIMEGSTKFLSLSGFSGVFLGLFAIAGALIAHFMILDRGDMSYIEYFNTLSAEETVNVRWQMIADALSVLFLSLLTAIFFSFRKAKGSGESFLTPVSKRMFINLLIPLVTGGLFAIILLFQEYYQLIVPGLLIFYGLALINAGKFTYNEFFYLGILEIITGLFCALFPVQGMIFWIIGFGILHIGYGLFMYRKYEA